MCFGDNPITGSDVLGNTTKNTGDGGDDPQYPDKTNKHDGNGITLVVLNRPGIEFDKKALKTQMYEYLGMMRATVGQQKNQVEINIVSETEYVANAQKYNKGYITVLGEGAKVGDFYKKTTALNKITSPEYLAKEYQKKGESINDLGFQSDQLPDISYRGGIGGALSGPAIGVFYQPNDWPKITNEQRIALAWMHSVGHNLGFTHPISGFMQDRTPRGQDQENNPLFLIRAPFDAFFHKDSPPQSFIFRNGNLGVLFVADPKTNAFFNRIYTK